MVNVVKTLHFNEEIRKNNMALKFVKRSQLPPSVRGKSAGGPTVAITENGQLQLSKTSSDFLKEAKTVVLGFDGLKTYIILPTAKLVAKVPAEDHCAVSYPKSGSGATISAAAILRSMKEFGASVQYDFKASRNQSFVATLDSKNECIVFDLPVEGKLMPKPVAHRTKTTKPTPTPEVAKAATVGEPELVLEMA